MMRDLTVSLGQVVDWANRIATGDLRGQTHASARKDEIGELGLAFERMVSALKEMVGVAERIAAGDLSLAVTPRSEHDAMGHALANMVARLATLMGDVQLSGIQVKTSVTEIAATAKEQRPVRSPPRRPRSAPRRWRLPPRPRSWSERCKKSQPLPNIPRRWQATGKVG